MGYPQTLNGHTYTDTGAATNFDFVNVDGFGFKNAFPNLIADFGVVIADVAADQAAAAVSETNAAASAVAAAASAATAVAAPGTSSTSVTSMSISVASKSFTTQTGKAYPVGGFVQIARTSDTTKWMSGTVTSYDSGTGAMVVGVIEISGAAGPFTDWTISICGAPGAASLPTQTGHNGEFLTTDGSSASWAAVNTNSTGLQLAQLQMGLR